MNHCISACGRQNPRPRIYPTPATVSLEYRPTIVFYSSISIVRLTYFEVYISESSRSLKTITILVQHYWRTRRKGGHDRRAGVLAGNKSPTSFTNTSTVPLPGMTHPQPRLRWESRMPRIYANAVGFRYGRWCSGTPSRTCSTTRKILWTYFWLWLSWGNAPRMFRCFWPTCIHGDRSGERGSSVARL